MEFLYLLEKIRTPFWDSFFLLVTRLGEETAFLIIALVLFWCFDKYKGYYILSVGFLGIIANQFMKLWFRVLRPWDLDQNFQIVHEAQEAASGYSFPSGHTQVAVGTLGGIAYVYKNRTIRIICIIMAAFVGFSRMYLGVHTPMDVFTSVALGLLLIVVMKPIILDNPQRSVPWVLGVMFVAGVVFAAFVMLYKFPADVDQKNVDSALENVYTMIGAFLGLLVVYIVDEKWLHFPTKAVWWVQVLKVVVGGVLVLFILKGLKQPLNALLGDELGRIVRYFMTVISAGTVWPLTFRWFGKLGTKES